MAAFTEVRPALRLLCLGNDILADDALGMWVAREVRRRYGDRVEVVWSTEAGFDLLERVEGASRLVAVDTIVTGNAEPGTIHVFEDCDVRPAQGGSPHFIGLFEVLQAARSLGLRVPRRITVVAVEAADCWTVGGPMHPDVLAAVPAVADRIGRLLEGGKSGEG
ncbi:MAG TPA: hydrogenase maturation protease [Candidatus Acidoferrales bacterium]|nr:hydrogenase maturation protease [Candidatus Acidoferrales bacterium]